MGIYATLARFIRDSTAAGRALLTAATASDQRTALGLGTAAQSASSDFAAAIHTHDDRYFTEAEIASLLTSYLTVSVAGTTYQPLDSDLTAIAALSTTSFGRSLLTQADAAATRTTIGAGTSSFDGAYSSLSGIPSSFTPSSHTHPQSDVTGLVSALAAKADLVGGLVPSSQLPSYVDDVLEYTNLASFPVTGETGKIYVDLTTNLTYRWSGSTYAVLDPSLALGETSTTAYRGDRGKTAYDHSQASGNAHNLTGSDVRGILGVTTLSGSNTGDQTITLTGDVTGSGTGTFSVTIGAGKVTNDMLAGSISASKLAITGTPDGTKYLRDDFSWQTISLAGYALTSGTLAQFASTSSSQFAGVISDETGSGLVVFNNAPALVSPTMDLITLTETLGAEIVVDGAFAAPTQYTCATAGVNITTDTMTLSSDPGWVVNDVVQYFNGGGASAGGLVHRGFYFIESNSAGVIGVKTTTAGAKVNLTSTGNNAQFFIKTNWFAGTSGTTGGIDGWDLSGGTASHQVAGTPTLRPAVALAPTPGQLYKIQYTTSNWTAAGFSLTFGGVLAQATTAPTGNGTRTLYVTALTNGDLSIVPVTGMRADLDNFSIRPVLSGVATSAIPMVFNETLSDAIANEVAYTFNYTVNKSSQGNNVGVQINMTDTSSPGTSNCFQITVNGTSFFTVNNAGNVSMAGLTSTSISCTSVTASGAVSAATGFSSAYAGAASTPVIRTSGALFTGGTGTTTFPQILQQPTAATAVTTWSTAGTFWGANGPTGFTGNFIDHHVNGGASVFIVDSTGRVTAAGGVVTGTLINTGTLTLPTSTDTLVGRATTDTLTNKRLQVRVVSTTSATSLTPDISAADFYEYTALAAGLTINNPTGTPVNGELLNFRLQDNGTGRALTWGAQFRSMTATLPTTTVANKTHRVLCEWNSGDSTWDCLAVSAQP